MAKPDEFFDYYAQKAYETYEARKGGYFVKWQYLIQSDKKLWIAGVKAMFKKVKITDDETSERWVE